MRYILLTMLTLVSCSRPPSFTAYREPGGEFSAEVPSDWRRNERGPFSRRPVGEVWWVGEVVDDHEGWPIGALLFVRRLDRRPAERQDRYRREVLLQTDALFDGTQPKEVSVSRDEFAGFPARRISRDFEEHAGGAMHGPLKTYPSRMRGLVIRTTDAYYVLEYRATMELFDKHLPVFERLIGSFHLHRSGGVE